MINISAAIRTQMLPLNYLEREVIARESYKETIERIEVITDGVSN
jgi:hypothetical protein